MKLNKEEKTILVSFERGNAKSVANASKEIGRYQEYAKYALQKNKRINIRIAERDLIRIQSMAVEEGLPYQTLIASILHKYVHKSVKRP